MVTQFERVLRNKQVEKQIFIQELLGRGITENKQGTSIDELEYSDLKFELTMARALDVEIEKPESKFF